MPCPYKEGSEYCIYNEDDPGREFQLIDKFKDIDPDTYKERMEWLKGLGLMSLYRAVKARMVKEQRTLGDFGLAVMSHE